MDKSSPFRVVANMQADKKILPSNTSSGSTYNYVY